MNYYEKYYEKNKERIKNHQRKYYHIYKDDPTKSHFLEHRLKLQRDKYKEKYPNGKQYKYNLYRKKEKHFPCIRFNHGLFIIILE